MKNSKNNKVITPRSSVYDLKSKHKEGKTRGKSELNTTNIMKIEYRKKSTSPPIRNINTTRLKALWYFWYLPPLFGSINDSRDQMIPQ